MVELILNRDEHEVAFKYLLLNNASYVFFIIKNKSVDGLDADHNMLCIILAGNDFGLG